MDSLPDDLILHIRSFLKVVSWRAETHYQKLLHRYKTLRFDTLRDRPHFIDFDKFYIYKLPDDPYYTQISKSDELQVNRMKSQYMYAYKKPLLQYLTVYREQNIQQAWSLTSSFQIFGVSIDGVLSNARYQKLLIYRAIREGVYDYKTWSGCIPLEDYKKACTLDRLFSIE
jgi:hypothetical protein